MPGAASYEVAINTGDPSVEASWIYEGTHKNANRILLEGLTPTQRVWVRMRGIGTNGPGAWTDPAGTVVL